MKRFLFTLIYLLPFSLVACTGEPSTSTPTTIVQLTSVATPSLPTVTTSTTSTPPPATDTNTLLSTHTTTVTPTNTGTATLMPTFTPTKTPVPTKTVTVTLPPTLPLVPPPTGRIYFLWDPTPLNGNNPLYADPKQSLFLATSDTTLDSWDVEPILNDLYGSPIVALSPDRTKLALRILEDANGDGSISNEGAGMFFDLPNLYIYNLTDSSFTRATENYPDMFSLSWLSDNQMVTYQNDATAFSYNLVDSSEQQLVGPFPDNIGELTWSPDGKLLAVGLYSGGLYLFTKDTSETIEVGTAKVGSNSEIVWSPTSQWFIATNTQTAGLIVIDPVSLVAIELMKPASFNAIQWSIDGQWLAFSEVERNNLGDFLNASLFIWNSQTKSSQLMYEATYISEPVWSQNNFTVGFLSVDIGGLLLVDPVTGSSTELFQTAGVVKINPLSWSPDGEWVLFLMQKYEETGLYLIHRNTKQTYLVLDTTDTIYPSNVFWLS